MQALVINLALEPERMAFMASQLDALSIPYERLEAVTPAHLEPPRDFPYWSRWERPLRTTEMAAFASHRAAWRAVLEGDAPRLILEDDAVLMPGAPRFLERLDTVRDVDLVTLETRGRSKLIGRDPHSAAPMQRLWQDKSGAAAYVLWPTGAQRLLDRVAYAPGLADAILCAAYDLRAWQAVPALACQLDRCAAEGIPPPLATTSAIDAEPRPKAAKTFAQSMRRIAAQVRIGLRRMRRGPGSDYAIVPLDRN
ncbi:glycosyltransferase family 25 protein [Hasllibacter sp. MH4015]|uniref:glycosyltransferase family 25 protein n=1 Tax=Hasllibacter sp. MH4015 TaxID=2854029 RepID=UPI001CD608B1|nr:glycosyltransferase family 25 protein [Hasllibacter sp. MH4015]